MLLTDADFREFQDDNVTPQLLIKIMFAPSESEMSLRQPKLPLLQRCTSPQHRNYDDLLSQSVP
jgi:hypothetical protein